MKVQQTISARAVHAISKSCRFDNRTVPTSSLVLRNSGLVMEEVGVYKGRDGVMGKWMSAVFAGA
jgi:hypothetical protein